MTDLATIAATPRPGDAIRARRIELGWTQALLAEMSGVSQADISRIENGRLDARWSTIHRLSAALDTDAEPRTSLANGNRRRPRTPRSDQQRWRPKGPTQPIESP